MGFTAALGGADGALDGLELSAAYTAAASRKRKESDQNKRGPPVTGTSKAIVENRSGQAKRNRNATRFSFGEVQTGTCGEGSVALVTRVLPRRGLKCYHHYR